MYVHFHTFLKRYGFFYLSLLVQLSTIFAGIPKNTKYIHTYVWMFDYL